MQVLCGLQVLFLLFNCQTPADFAFDNPITDYLVQTKLQSLGEEVEDTIQLTEELLAHIRTQ